MNDKTLMQLKRELDYLLYVYSDPRVQEQIKIVQAERAPRVKELSAKIELLREVKPAKKPRWPEGTPAEVIEVCERYWRGTTEFHTFRIHCWNSKVVCTSYPSGGYSDNGGWHPTPATFYFLSLTELEFNKPKRLGRYLEGRQSLKNLTLELAARTAVDK
jgi:hypothetical protein